MPKSYKTSVFEIIADSSLTGAPRHLLTLLSGIDRNKFVVSVILPEGELVSELKKIKIPVFTVPMKGKSDLVASSSIKKIIKKYEPDIIHTHGQRAGLLGRLAVRDLPVTRIHTEHTYTSNFKLDNSLLHWSHLRAMAMLDRWTHKTIAVSNAVKTFLISAGITKADKVLTIYNGIESQISKISAQQIKEFKSQFGLTSSDLVIGTVGSLNKHKDTATLIRAFSTMIKKWPHLKLLLIGRGELQPQLKNLVKKLGISERVIFAGSMKDIDTAMSVFNIFILPSRSEAFGLTILEAMRANIPVIASRVGGIPEIITHNYNGMLVEHGDPKKLASAIMKLLNDKKLQKKFISHYSETLKKFSARSMIKQTEELYHSLTHIHPKK